MDDSKEDYQNNISNVFRNDSFTVNDLVEWLDESGLTALGLPYVCIYKQINGAGDYLELDFFLPLSA